MLTQVKWAGRDVEIIMKFKYIFRAVCMQNYDSYIPNA